MIPVFSSDVTFKDVSAASRSSRCFIYTFHGTGSLEDLEIQQDTGDTNSFNPDSSVADCNHDILETSTSQVSVSPGPGPSPEMELRRAAAITILKTRELHRIPLSVMDEIIFDNQSLFLSALRQIRNRVCHEMASAGISQSVASSVLNHLQETSPLASIYSGLTTQHQQTRFFQDNFHMVVSILYYSQVLGM